jgi:hypothetical protein
VADNDLAMMSRFGTWIAMAITNTVERRKVAVRDINWIGYRNIAWAGIAILAVTLVLVIVQANWLGVGFIGGFLLASIAFVKWEHKLPTLFDLIFVAAALLNGIGSAWDLYNKPGLYDEIAHFCSIFAITLTLGFLLFSELMESFHGHRVLFVITIASLGIAFGALWEILEWSADFLTPKQIVSGLFDTITDLILDSAGAVLAALLNLWGLNELARAADSDSQDDEHVSPFSKAARSVRS